MLYTNRFPIVPGEIEPNEVNRSLLPPIKPPSALCSGSTHVNVQTFESGRSVEGSVGSYAQPPTSPPRGSSGDSARRSSSSRPRLNSTSGVGTWTQSATEPYPYSVSVGTPRPSPELVSSNSSDGTGSSLDMTNQNEDTTLPKTLAPSAPVPMQQSDDFPSAEVDSVSNGDIPSSFLRDVSWTEGPEDTSQEDTSGLLLSSSLYTFEEEDTALKSPLTTFQQPQSLISKQYRKPQQPKENADPSSIPECSSDGYSARSWGDQYPSDGWSGPAPVVLDTDNSGKC